MFCPKCGSEVQEGQAFCGKCGAPVGSAQAGTPASGAGAGNDGVKAAVEMASGTPAPKKNGTKVGIAIAAAVVVLLVVVGIATNGFGIGGSQLQEAVEAPAESQETDTQNDDASNADEPSKTNFEGDWMLSGGTSAGQEVTAADISAMEESGAYVFAQLKSDGGAVLSMYGSSFEGTWKSTDSSSGYLVLAGDSGSFEVPLKLEGDQLALDFGGELLLFKKGSIPEEAFTAPATATQTSSRLDSYSWAELSQMSAEIAAASSEEEAVSIAAGYGLCSASGPSASETKSITMVDGTQAEVQIIGFAHDVKPDGSKAGITFIFKDAISEHPMNPTDTNKGGWAGSEIREYLATQMSNLPEDLQQVIVPVVKMTNNTGETTSTSSVTTTEDSLWLLSAVEVRGEGVDKNNGSGVRGNNSGPKMAAIFDLEGTQYPYFKSLLDQDDYVRRDFFNKANRYWWSRSPYSESDEAFKLIGSAGDDIQADADAEWGVVPCFCI